LTFTVKQSIFSQVMKTYTPDSLIIASRQDLIDIISDQALQLASTSEQLAKLSDNITELKMQLDWLKRQIFGTKSERFLPADDLQEALQLNILNKEDVNAGTETKTVSYRRDSKPFAAAQAQGHGRGGMPSHLPVKEITINPEGDLTGMECIGEEVSWYYEMDKPASLHIVRITRPKYVRPKEDGVFIGKMPAMPVEKGNAGPGLIASIIIDKYVYHLPLDRQRKKYKNEYNADFSESWLCDNVKNGTFWLETVHNAHVNKIIASNYLQADETPIQVLTKDKKGKTHRGYFWVYHDPLQKIVLFDYRKSRASAGPSEFLKDFKGTLQVDGYEGYNEIVIRNGLTHAACMDHVRRRFEKSLDYDKERAAYALDTMRAWYEVEREARENELTLDDRFAMRVEKTVPSMMAFKEWLQKEVSMVLPKSVIGNAFSYFLDQWPFFKPFMTDKRIELSNILIENAIRPVALGRKNFMFAGSHEAAKWPAIIYSLVSTAKWHGYDPFVYIKELLTELPKSTTKDIQKYLFPNWKPGSLSK
jgi:transposase